MGQVQLPFNRFWSRLILLLLLIGAYGLPTGNGRAKDQSNVEEMQRLFQTPPDDARLMMRWWWFGPAVTKTEITRELRAMNDAGIGGVEIQAVYPVALDDAGAGIKNLTFLSDEHIDALRHANNEARALGLRVDLTLGSGWPFGGPSVPIEQAAGRLRVERVKLPDGEDRVRTPAIEPGEKLLAVFLARTSGEAISSEGTRELSSGADDNVVLPLDRAGATELIFFISSRTKQQVKRAGVGAEGLVLDHYDRAAVEAYLGHVGERLLQAFSDKPPYAVFCDSLEVYLSDWTPDLLAEFQKRRGYDLTPFLPALVADFGPRTAEVRHDWGETLTELFNERFVQPIREWAARHHTRFRFQAYGIPPATLSTNRLVDFPEGEGAQWKSLSATRWASSASHLYGFSVTSSEAWTWLHSPAFRATPLDMKAEADLHFLSGINQLVGHGWPYTAPGAEYPGWRFYAAGALNDQNPWWIVMPDLTRYLQRVSFILRQGQPANDIALYLPNSDAWAQFSRKQPANLFETLRKCVGKDIAATLLDAGYNFDFFDDEALRTVGKVEQGALVLGANRYKAVILPNVERIPLETLRALADFAQRGGVVIGTRRLPEMAPGLQATDTEQKAVREMAQRLFSKAGAPAHLAADEKAALSALLTSLIPPDVVFSEDKADLGFLHRHTGDAEIYFIANTGPMRRHARAAFRVSGAQAECWNPLTGEVTAVEAVASETHTTLPLELEPYESKLIVFTHRHALGLPRSTPSLTNLPGPLDLSAGWQVSFANGKTITMEHLHSWTDDEATRYYSGRANYEKMFNVPQGYLQKETRVLLDLGSAKPLPVKPLTNGTRAWIDAPVGEAALVFLNGERVGVVWHPPYTLNVTRFLRPGANQLKIIVGNTAINHLAGERPTDYKLLNARYGERFKPQDMDKLQPLVSGLIGPIQLLSSAREPEPIAGAVDAKNRQPVGVNVPASQTP